ncbi:Peptidyl-prolyl cis-trans isomerase FKBP11, partial [Camelus dromedarius]
GGDKVEEGLQEEELACRDPPRPVQSGLGAEGTAVLAAATQQPVLGALIPAPHPVMTLRPSLLQLRLLLLLLGGAACRAEAGFETESPVRTLQVETLVEPPEPCAEPAAFGDTLHIHYTGSLVDGRIIDTSLTRDPLVIELGQKQVIPGLEQSLLDMCVGEKRRVIIPSDLAYGKRGFPPSIPADAVLHFDVELIALIRANYWQKLVKGILPLVGMAMVPALLGLIGYHLYRKASTPKVSKKKLKEEKRNKSKKK